MNNDEILLFGDTSPEKSTSTEMRGGDRSKGNPKSIKISELSGQIENLQEKLTSSLEKIKNDKSGIYLDEVTINAEISAEGKLGIPFFGVNTGAKTGISLKFKLS